MNAEFRFDPGKADFISNPYPTFAELRAHEPMYWDARTRVWLPTRFDDIKLILSDPRFGGLDQSKLVGAADSNIAQQLSHVAYHSLSYWMVNRNPPDHTRLRALMAPWFSKNAMEHLRPAISARVEQLLARVQPFGTTDLLADFADELTFTTISEIMGIPHQDRPSLQKGQRELLGLLGFNATALTRARAAMAMLNVLQYFNDLAGWRMREAGDDLFSALVLAHTREGLLTREELAPNAVMLMVGGEANTRAAIGNSVIALLEHPEQLEVLREHPENLRQAIEELLRYENSKQIVLRVALADVVVSGELVRKGDVVQILLGAANRDPEIFPNPDGLELTRAPNPHLSFGFGIHYCLGAYLARLEIEIALTALLEHMPRLALAAPLEWNASFFPRGVHALPVRF